MSQNLSRRDFVKSLGLGAAALMLPAQAFAARDKKGRRAKNQAAPPAPAGKPNIIFILADDLGYGDVGCYGQKNFKTPNLDTMAAEGIRFTDVYSGNTVCAPSRCALMTGLDMGHALIRGNALQSLRPEDVTIAMTLKQAGYKTGLCGKWGLGEEGTEGVPTKKGYDYFFGYLNQKHAHNYYTEFLFRNEEKIAIDNPQAEYNVAKEKKVWSHDLIAKEALEFVDRSKDGPFFLYYAVTLPHANNEGARATGNGEEIPSLGEYANAPWPECEKGRAAMIARLDKDVGELFAKLKALGLDENTIVFFTSDNGPHKEGGTGSSPDVLDDNGPLRGLKRDLYEGGIRVPMIVRWPGKIKPGQTSAQVWGFIDFPPTAAELAGATFPGEIQGISMVKAILGQPGQQQHEYLYWEFYEGGFKQAARVGNWKAVGFDVNGRIELYDLSQDLGETKDVAAGHPDVVEQMRALFKRAHVDNDKWNLAHANNPPTEPPTAGAAPAPAGGEEKKTRKKTARTKKKK